MNTTIPPGVRGTSSKRLSLQSILGGMQTGKEEVGKGSGGRSTSESLSTGDALDAVKVAIPPSIQPYKGSLHSSPSTSVHAAVHSDTSPGRTAVNASCASGVTQPYDSPQDSYPVKAPTVYPKSASPIVNRRSLSTPAAVSSKELQDFLTDSILPVINNLSSAKTANISTKELQATLIESILPVIKSVTAQTIKVRIYNYTRCVLFSWQG